MTELHFPRNLTATFGKKISDLPYIKNKYLTCPTFIFLLKVGDNNFERKADWIIIFKSRLTEEKKKH